MSALLAAGAAAALVPATLYFPTLYFPALGCGDPCVELQEMCDRCKDPNHKAACEATIDADESDACERGLESYRTICP